MLKIDPKMGSFKNLEKSWKKGVATLYMINCLKNKLSYGNTDVKNDNCVFKDTRCNRIIKVINITITY